MDKDLAATIVIVSCGFALWAIISNVLLSDINSSIQSVERYLEYFYKKERINEGYWWY